MKQQRLEVPQRTLYGVHRPQRYEHRDMAPHLEFIEDFPPMQKWEKVAFAMITGFVLGFIVFGGYFGFPW
jgi:hypothetical protein